MAAAMGVVRACLPALVVLGGLLCPPGLAQTTDVGRGRMLYQNTCETCHTEQVHWRDKRLVHDWPSLIYQVTRWQKSAGQRWGEDEVRDVASFLNRMIYRLPCPVPGCGAEEKVGLAPQPHFTGWMR